MVRFSSDQYFPKNLKKDYLRQHYVIIMLSLWGSKNIWPNQGFTKRGFVSETQTRRLLISAEEMEDILTSTRPLTLEDEGLLKEESTNRYLCSR